MTTYRFMVTLWRREVYAQLSQKIETSYASVFSNYRQDLIEGVSKTFNQREDEICLIIRIVEALVDISVQEVSIQFLEHSSFRVEGPYEILHHHLLESSLAFYSKVLKMDKPDLVQSIFKAEDLLLKRSVLPCTQIALEQDRDRMLLNFWRKKFAQEFAAFDGKQVPSFLDINVVQHLTKETQFGRFLFATAPSRETFGKINNFIKSLASLDDTKLHTIYQFNELQAKIESLDAGEKLHKDEEIESRNEFYGFEIEQPAEERMLFTMTRDLTPGDIENLMQSS